MILYKVRNITEKETEGTAPVEFYSFLPASVEEVEIERFELTDEKLIDVLKGLAEFEKDLFIRELVVRVDSLVHTVEVLDKKILGDY